MTQCLAVLCPTPARVGLQVRASESLAPLPATPLSRHRMQSLHPSHAAHSSRVALVLERPRTDLRGQLRSRYALGPLGLRLVLLAQLFADTGAVFKHGM